MTYFFSFLTVFTLAFCWKNADTPNIKISDKHIASIVQQDTTPKRRTIRGHNYLRPIPLKDIGDEILLAHVPSLENTIIATQEFKERYDKTFEVYRKYYPIDSANGLAAIFVYIYAEELLKNPNQLFFEMDNLCVRIFMQLNAMEMNSAFLELANFYASCAEQKETILKINALDSASAAYFRRLSSVEQCFFGKSGKMMARILLDNIDLSENIVEEIYQASSIKRDIGTLKGWKANYFYPPFSENCSISESYIRSNIKAKVSMKNLRQAEPKIILYCPSKRKQNTFIATHKDKYGVFYEGLNKSVVEERGVNYYFLALGQNTEGKMVGAIRKFQLSDTTNYIITDFFVTDYFDFERRIDALK